MKLMSSAAPLPPLLGGISALASSLVMPLVIRSRQLTGSPLCITDSRREDATLGPEIRWFEPGETGLTFQNLFGKHLFGVPEVTVVDPHVKTFRQIRIFGEFLESLVPDPLGEITVHLVTSTAIENPGWAHGQVKALIALQESAKAKGIKLCVKFDETIHDRWIQTSKWTILLGKGLDIWEACTCYSRPQEERPISKKFAITYATAK